AKEVIKVLAIGNSFSEDALEEHLYQLSAAAGDSLVIGNAYIGGCSLERHRDNADTDAAAYEYRKITGGTMTNTAGKTLLNILQDEPWDYISVQQVSQLSGMYDSYFPFLTELIAYVKSHVVEGSKPTLVLHRTWAYAESSTHGGFVNYNKNQGVMYSAIVSATDKVLADVADLAFIVPAGTAIQNGRSSSLGDVFCRDGYHLQKPLGRYTAACVWFEKLTGKSVVGNTYAPDGLSPVEVSIAQNAAHYAVLQPDAVTFK
ncbi:MAG: DUF4886 domain-containing protein, partial [Tannerella sp.]|nr:DUF4886 domain-containing protein [Tannerella sp.]